MNNNMTFEQKINSVINSWVNLVLILKQKAIAKAIYLTKSIKMIINCVNIYGLILLKLDNKSEIAISYFQRSIKN